VRESCRIVSGFPALFRSKSMSTLSEQDVLRLLMQSRDRISAAVWLVTRDTQVSEDIFQNVVVKALTREVSFEVEGAVLSWAFITARREGIDWLRRHGRESNGLDPVVLDLVSQEWLTESARDGGDRVSALRECLERLPDESRQMLRMRYYEGYNCGEVAETFRLGLDAVYKRVSRLHAQLRQCVESRVGRMGVEPS